MNTSTGEGKPHKTRKGYTMKSTVTYAIALDYVLNQVELPEAIHERLSDLQTALAKRNQHHGEASPAKKEADKAKRAENRKQVLDAIVPLVRQAMDTEPRTVKEIFERMKDNCPEGFTIPKLQYMFTHNEIGDDVVKVDNGKNPFTYHI